ncbi:MAG: serine/threonine protein kinase [Planctomycetes bacterium]|nr:serine/threonine protein kinase [Planctomycetota bacterium]
MTSPTLPEPDEAELTRAIDVFERRGSEGYRHWLRRRPGDGAALDRRMRALFEAGLLHSIDAEDPEREERLGRYRLLRRLGDGAMGVVHLAIDDELDRLVAIKRIAPAFARDERLRERFRREARAVALLKHPSIVPVLEIGDSGQELYAVLEFVEGTTLDEGLVRLRALDVAPAAIGAPEIADAFRLSGATVAERDLVRFAARVGREVADALAHAHAAGVLHRDVKPSNVIVDADGRARLIDFGLARVGSEARMTFSADVLGTPQYLAPEVIDAGIGAADGRIDVWALGVCLYECATLTAPFEGVSAAHVLRLVLERDPEAPSARVRSIPRDFDAICAVALAKDRLRRYSDAAALRDDLARLMAGEPVRAREPGTLERALAFARRRPLASTLAGALLLLGIGTVVLVLEYNARLRLRGAQAAAERDSAETALKFLQEILEQSDVEELGPEAPASALLAQGAVRVRDATRWQSGSLVRPRLARTMGALSWGAGDLATARELLELACKLLAEPPDAALDPAQWKLERARAFNYLGNVLRAQGDPEGALARYQDALEALSTFTDAPVRARELEATLCANLADGLAAIGEYEQAEGHARRTLDLCTDEDEEGLANRAWGEIALARILTRQGKFDAARERIDDARRTSARLRSRPLQEAAVLDTAALLAADMGDRARAVALFEQEVELYRRTSGPSSPLVGETLVSLGELLALADEPERAVECLREAAVILEAAAGADHPKRQRALELLAGIEHARAKGADDGAPAATPGETRKQ